MKLRTYPFQEGVGNDRTGNVSIRVDEDSPCFVENGGSKCDLLGTEG